MFQPGFPTLSSSLQQIYDTTYSLSLSLHRGCLQCFARVLLLGRYSDTVSHGRPAKTNDSTDIPYVTSNVEQQRVLVPSLMYGCHWLPCGVVPVPKNNKKWGK